MRKTMFLFTLFTGLFALSACGDSDDYKDVPKEGSEEAVVGDNDTDLQEFTLEELSHYDGTDGKDAYVAVDGDVYDMTNSSYWNDGGHQGQVQAGQDLTDQIDADSPHGRDVLSRVPKIGILVESNDDDEDDSLDDDVDEDEPVDDDNDDTDLREFTLEELSHYDGTDGKDAYVAVDGDVYDMTNSSYWNDGGHQGQVQAGQDLTDQIDADSPHGRDVLSRVPKIGILVDSG